MGTVETILSKIYEDAKKGKEDYRLLALYYKLLDYLLIFESIIYNDNPKKYEEDHEKLRICALQYLIQKDESIDLLKPYLNDLECVLKHDFNDAMEKAYRAAFLGNIDDDIKDIELSLIVTEVSGIQKYVFAMGNSLVDVQGASIHVDSVCRLLGERIREIYGSEALIQASAGETVALIPKQVSDKVLDDILKYIKEVPFVFDNLPLKINRDSMLTIRIEDVFDRQKGFFGKLYKATLNETDYIDYTYTEPSGDVEIVKPSELCKVCYNEKMIDFIQYTRSLFGGSIPSDYMDFITRYGKDKQIGKLCARKRVYAYVFRKVQGGGKEQGEFAEIARKLGIIGSSLYDVVLEINRGYVRNRVALERYPNDLDDYNYDRGRNALIMLIHGDGDGFGSMKTMAKTVFDFRILSYIYSETMKNALVNAFNITGNSHYQIFYEITSGGNTIYYNPLVMVYFGGDDFVVIGRAEAMLKFLEGFYKGLKKKYNDLQGLIKETHIESITVSLGIAIGKTKTPIFMLYKAAGDVLRNVKAIGKKIKMDVGIKADFIYFRGDYSEKYLKDITSFSEKLGIPALIVRGQSATSIVDYQGKIYNLIGCGEGRRLPIVSASDLAEYVEASYPIVFTGSTRLTGDWLLLKIAYDAGRFASPLEHKNAKSAKLKDLYQLLYRIRQEAKNPGYVWVIILKLLDIYDTLRDFAQNISKNVGSKWTDILMTHVCRELIG